MESELERPARPNTQLAHTPQMKRSKVKPKSATQVLEEPSMTGAQQNGIGIEIAASATHGAPQFNDEYIEVGVNDSGVSPFSFLLPPRPPHTLSLRGHGVLSEPR